MSRDRIFDEYARDFIAEKMQIPRHEIRDFKFLAEPSRAWSDVTYEDWNCTIGFTHVHGKKVETKRIYLNESETAEFLNGFGSIQ